MDIRFTQQIQCTRRFMLYVNGINFCLTVEFRKLSKERYKQVKTRFSKISKRLLNLKKINRHYLSNYYNRFEGKNHLNKLFFVSQVHENIVTDSLEK